MEETRKLRRDVGVQEALGLIANDFAAMRPDEQLVYDFDPHNLTFERVQIGESLAAPAEDTSEVDEPVQETDQKAIVPTTDDQNKRRRRKGTTHK
jgi:hypothetical protein